jgi:hypothetical protein
VTHLWLRLHPCDSGRNHAIETASTLGEYAPWNSIYRGAFGSCCTPSFMYYWLDANNISCSFRQGNTSTNHNARSSNQLVSVDLIHYFPTIQVRLNHMYMDLFLCHCMARLCTFFLANQEGWYTPLTNILPAKTALLFSDHATLRHRHAKGTCNVLSACCCQGDPFISILERMKPTAENGTRRPQ